jgi:hypothetical protein
MDWSLVIWDFIDCDAAPLSPRGGDGLVNELMKEFRGKFQYLLDSNTQFRGKSVFQVQPVIVDTAL